MTFGRDRLLRIFIATRAEAVPRECRRFLSVDGSVPGYAVRWDHHATGEHINLDAMPERFDPSDYDGVGTTLADMARSRASWRCCSEARRTSPRRRGPSWRARRTDAITSRRTPRTTPR